MAFMTSMSEAELRKSGGFLQPTIITSNAYEVYDHSTDLSFLLMDANEKVHVDNAESFCKLLKCHEEVKLKIVTIFGNTGDGKSHTLNNAFFHGQEVFRTSPQQNSCTLGVYAAMQPEMNAICLDTEGLLSTSSQSSGRMRMLYKILAISDVVIYRNRSERLDSDMFVFLGNASKAFCLYFSQPLESLYAQSATNLGPAVIVFHETSHTDPLQNTIEGNAGDKIRQRFAKLNYDIKAFSSLRYVGLKNNSLRTTDYKNLIAAINWELENTSVRAPRTPGMILQALHTLNNKYCSDIGSIAVNPFPEEYFTCPIVCVSCNRRCKRPMGHEGENHFNAQPCWHQHQLENKVELCKSCCINGREMVVTRKYGWTSDDIHCPHCGVITTVFKYWNANQHFNAITTQIIHVWNDSNFVIKEPAHSAQLALEKVSYVFEGITHFSSQPADALKEWCADMVAPKYWRPNNEIISCFDCKRDFQQSGLRKHHCRGCGEGFCDACTQHRLPVPARKWFDNVRICGNCYNNLLIDPVIIPGPARLDMFSTVEEEEGDDVILRKYGETVYNTVSNVARTAIECTKEIIKDTARPDYWVPDSEAIRCHICKLQFGTADELALAYAANNTPANDRKAFRGCDCRRHHCRKCGKAVCDECSLTRIPVPERGWLSNVRVCDECVSDMSTKHKTH